MKIKLIFIIALVILLVVFSVQNAEIVPVKFLFWQLEISRALLILISAGIGALTFSIISFSSSFKKTSTQKDPSNKEQPTKKIKS